VTPPSISIGGSTSGSPNTPYTYTASASACTPGATWSWSVGDGSISGGATGASITVSWATAGSKFITVTNAGCSGTQGSLSVNISSGNGGGGGGGGNAGLAAHFTSTPSGPKAGDTVTFDGTSSTGPPTGYAWDFGDGATATGSTATHAFAAAGNYPVKLTVFKPGAGTGCQLGTCFSDSTVNVFVAPNGPPPLDGDYTPSIPCSSQAGFTVCDGSTGQAVTFTANATGATSYSWDFGDGTKGTGPTPSHTWLQPGTYAVSLTVVSGSQTVTKTRTFVVTGQAVVLS